MRIAKKVMIAVVAAAAAIGGSAGTATAAMSPHTTAASCGWEAFPKGGLHYPGWGDAEYWLSFNTCNDTARGAVNSNTVEDAGQYAWHVWVYNEDNNVTADAWDSPYQTPNKYTAPIDDSLGTESHVCIQPSWTPGGPPIATTTKRCTAYY
jgi:hypothetical protein